MWIRRLALLATLVILAVGYRSLLRSQELPVISTAPDNPPAAGADDPATPKGVEVQARGPVHEAFATPSAEAKATYGVPKKPPEALEEMPPDEKPDDDAVWIGGYWAWDDDRQDFLWVSGCWRVKPEGKEWMPGYWREVGAQHQWVPGFWTNVAERASAEVTYYPEPPPPPQLAPPAPPEPDMFYVPGYWMWTGDRYVWRAGYYTRMRAGHVYVSSHYRWTPHGYVFVSGYWDLAIARRGVLYAPVVVDTVVVGPRFVYTPYYAVTDTIVVDAFFVRPGFCHYYFGDYYGPRYVGLGFECGFHYSRRHYDAIVVYSRWEHRHEPAWLDVHINLSVARHHGRAPVPPRTLVQQNNITRVTNVTNVTNIKNVTINNNNTTNNNTNTTNVSKTQVLAPTKAVMAARGTKPVQMDAKARAEVKQSSQSFQKAAHAERSRAESTPAGAGPPAKPRTASLNVPPNQGPNHGSKAKLSGPGAPPKSPANPAAINSPPKGINKNPNPPLTTTLPKNPEGKGPAGGQPFGTKKGGTGEPIKLKGPDGPGATPGGPRPMVTRPPEAKDRPAPAKKAPPEEGKKKGR